MEEEKIITLSELAHISECLHDDITELIIKIPLIVANRHNPCTSDDPDDRCENCNCWKSTRSNCS